MGMMFSEHCFGTRNVVWEWYCIFIYRPSVGLNNYFSCFYPLDDEAQILVH
jgi:hypothetical protein